MIGKSKKSIAENIMDWLKSIWAEELDLCEGIFLTGGGGELFASNIQPLFDNRLISVKESQFANAIGYLRLRKAIFDQKSTRNII